MSGPVNTQKSLFRKLTATLTAAVMMALGGAVLLPSGVARAEAPPTGSMPCSEVPVGGSGTHTTSQSSSWSSTVVVSVVGGPAGGTTFVLVGNGLTLMFDSGGHWISGGSGPGTSPDTSGTGAYYNETGTGNATSVAYANSQVVTQQLTCTTSTITFGDVQVTNYNTNTNTNTDWHTAVTNTFEPVTTGSGYRLAAGDGGVFAYGGAGYLGGATMRGRGNTVVGMATTPDGGGYWLVCADGAVFAYGDAKTHGDPDLSGLKLAAPIVGMAGSADGGGYWLVGADGGVFAYGDAQFNGSAATLALNAPVVGIAATTAGGGYWLGASDGGVFAYGDAQFNGSAATLALNAPVVGISTNGALAEK